MGKSNMALTIVCCLWGGWPSASSALGEEYVYALWRGVQRNLTVDHNFICFADNVKRLFGAPFEVRHLNPVSWLGCLPKTYVYSPDAGLTGRVILFDLDNVITGNINKMTEYDGDIAVRAWFGGYPREKVADGDMISFNADATSTNDLWNVISNDPEKVEQETGGRERWYIKSVVNPDLWQDILGNDYIVSYKRHCRSVLPDNARVVSFHGNPRPHELDVKWIKENWS